MNFLQKLILFYHFGGYVDYYLFALKEQERQP
jgi:hypothetical protein